MVYYLSSQKLAPHYVDVQNLDGDPQRIELVDSTPDDGRYFTKATDPEGLKELLWSIH